MNKCTNCNNNAMNYSTLCLPCVEKQEKSDHKAALRAAKRKFLECLIEDINRNSGEVRVAAQTLLNLMPY